MLKDDVKQIPMHSSTGLCKRGREVQVSEVARGSGTKRVNSVYYLKGVITNT